MRNLVFGLVCAACVALGAVEAASLQQAPASPPRLDPWLCLDAAGLGYSKNAMVKVTGHIQRCDGGNRWVASLGDFTRDEKAAAASAGKRDCVGTHAESYESGLFRQNEKQFERCEDGEWIPERKPGSRS